MERRPTSTETPWGRTAGVRPTPPTQLEQLVAQAPPREPDVVRELRRARVRPPTRLGVLVPVVPIVVGLVVAGVYGDVVKAGAAAMVVAAVGLLMIRDRFVEGDAFKDAARDGHQQAARLGAVVRGRFVTRIRIESAELGSPALGWVVIRGRVTVEDGQPLVALIGKAGWWVVIRERLYAGSRDASSD